MTYMPPVPRYRPSDLPKIARTPLEDLARVDSKMTDADVQIRVRTALHEAAHLVAAILRRGYVTGVDIHSPGRAARTGAYGGTGAVGILADDDAFHTLAGYAWEERYGVVARAESDLRTGRYFASSADRPFDVIMDEARRFVVAYEEVIRAAAAGILGLVPKSGYLKGRTLKHLLAWVRTLKPTKRALRAAASLAALPAPGCAVT